MVAMQNKKVKMEVNATEDNADCLRTQKAVTSEAETWVEA
jgi:hypothetical protein